MEENQARVYMPGESPVAEPVTQDVMEEAQPVVEEAPQEVVQEVETENAQPVEETIQEPVQASNEAEQPVEEAQDSFVEIQDETPAPQQQAPVQEAPQTEYEWVNKLVQFAKDNPGANLQDYMRINQSFDELSDDQVLSQYYKASKPYLNDEEIALQIEADFDVSDYDEDDRDYKLKMIQKKEEISKAKAYLEEQKSKYQADIKSSAAPEEYKEAVEYYEGHKKQQEVNQVHREKFMQANDAFFSEDTFKGFTFEKGERKFLFKVSDVQGTKDAQSDIGALLGSFRDSEGNVTDIEGYHKAVYAARNADRIFNEAYELGKAEALKERAQITKNIDMAPNTSVQRDPNAQIPQARVIVDPLGLK